MNQPKDYAVRSAHMPDYSMIMRVLSGVMIVLIAVTLMWTAKTLTNLNTQVAVLISQNEIQFDNIDRRITEHARMPVHGLVQVSGPLE